jgi:uncharacterized protein YecT (DUF1311 family)
MSGKNFCIATLLTAALVVAYGAAAKSKSGDSVLVTAPSGDFRLELASDSGTIWLVPTKNPSARAALPPVEIEVIDSVSNRTKKVSSDTLESWPRCFISPDERWIFVSSGIVYRRVGDTTSSEVFNYQPAIADGFDEVAWRFFCQERNVSEDAIGIPNRYGTWGKNIEFCAWSTDSARLLVALSGTIGKPKEPEDGGPTQYESSASAWMCYFNTRTGAFEQTDRLRKANSVHGNSTSPELAAEPGAVLSAEAIGQESVEISVNDRLKKADAELNEIYGKLLKPLSAVQRVQLQNEERAWLKDRDTFAAIHANQSWSPFPNASRIEGLAVATEMRAAELGKRMPAPK